MSRRVGLKFATVIGYRRGIRVTLYIVYITLYIYTLLYVYPLQRNFALLFLTKEKFERQNTIKPLARKSK
jgi:hypothetical protein